MNIIYHFISFHLIQASRGQGRSVRRNKVAPTRRSSRLSTQQIAAEIERSIYPDSEDFMCVESEPAAKVSFN